jgi:hypothetical protein
MLIGGLGARRTNHRENQPFSRALAQRAAVAARTIDELSTRYRAAVTFGETSHSLQTAEKVAVQFRFRNSRADSFDSPKPLGTVGPIE